MTGEEKNTTERFQLATDCDRTQDISERDGNWVLVVGFLVPKKEKQEIHPCTHHCLRCRPQNNQMNDSSCRVVFKILNIYFSFFIFGSMHCNYTLVGSHEFDR